MTLDSRTRWFALIVLCLGTLMIVLDTTIVNVALPSIRDDLGFSADLARLGRERLPADVRRLPAARRAARRPVRPPPAVPGRASRSSRSRRCACGLATSQELLIAARAVQGVGGAVASAVSLSLMMTPLHRARRARQGDGRLRLRRLRRRLDRRAARRRPHRRARLALDLPRQPPDRHRRRRCSRCGCCRAVDGQSGAGRLDVAGAVTVTAALMLAVYAIVNGNQDGWTSAETLGLLAVAVALLARLPADRVARQRRRSCRSACSSCATSRPRTSSACSGPAAMFAWFFLVGALPAARARLQPAAGRPRVPAGQPHHGRALGRRLGEARDALRHQAAARRPGCCSRPSGSLLFARAPVDGSFVVDVLPSMLLLGFGAGIAFNPVLLAAMSDVAPEESGLASGVVNTSFMMGGALGLAVLASLAASRTDTLDGRRRQPPRGAHRRLPRRVRRRRALRRRGRCDRRARCCAPPASRPARHDGEHATATHTPAEAS